MEQPPQAAGPDQRAAEFEARIDARRQERGERGGACRRDRAVLSYVREARARAVETTAPPWRAPSNTPASASPPNGPSIPRVADHPAGDVTAEHIEDC